MAFQTWQHQLHFSRHITTTTKRESVIDQAGAARLNNPVQMGTANPFAMTMENPWLGMNHMFLGSSDMVIQAQPNPSTSTPRGPANSPPADDRRKRPRVSMENLFYNFNVNYPIQYSPALESIKNDMEGLVENERMLSQQTKQVRTQFAEKQSQAVGHLLDSVRAPLLKDLKDKDEEIANERKLNMELQEKVNNLFHQVQTWKKYATSCEIKVMSARNNMDDLLAEINRLQELVRALGAVVAPPVEQDVKSHCESTAQGGIRVKVEEAGETAAAKKVQTGTAETGEGSGEKMCKSCGKKEMTSFWGMPCKHACASPATIPAGLKK